LNLQIQKEKKAYFPMELRHSVVIANGR